MIMGSFAALLQGGNDEHGSRKKTAACLLKEFPLVAEALTGTPSENGNPEVPRCAISFYLDGGQAKFVIRVKGNETALFGVCGDLLNPWGSINSALLVGDVSRKRHSEQDASLSKVPY